ncbi:MAG: Ryanodine receptor Ryr [Oscillospiraceae bacterium]|jgi:hypothetical protein|nr:Ryanodine receptor Ryr [Oscillospiraceae bacterium]MBQ2382475.1 Ryanodine receptor Ryr [Oscillospiraceae bacterium]MBQ5712112.1 Ryanodine receptor Ryr [Oscillospiraceae bacterium]
MYTPTPVDTRHIELPDHLLELTELIARNVHDVWARGRIDEGWTFGPRDDQKKTHPCLIPYEELTDSEKAYDRNTALETLRLIVSLGYRIDAP